MLWMIGYPLVIHSLYIPYTFLWGELENGIFLNYKKSRGLFIFDLETSVTWV